MSNGPVNAGTIEALQSVLAAMIDPINQLFLHSRMLRSWGHSLGMTRNLEWLAKMRRTGELASAMHRFGAAPANREARDLTIGSDPLPVLRSDAEQTRWFLAVVADAKERCDGDESQNLLEHILQEERQDLARLETWIAGPEAEEKPRNDKFLMPKPGSAERAVAAINTVLPSITSAVSQVFHHSLLFQGEGKADLAQRELDMALALMYRSEAMLERLLDLGGLPTGSGHGAIRIGGSERDADRVCLAALDDMVSSLEHARAPIEGLADPTTHTLLDGIARALRDDRAVVAARLAA